MDIEQARFNMIEQQIRTWEVLDQTVLDLINEIHREDFVPDSYQNLAFADIRIPIGHEQTMMTPKVEARLLQTLELEPDESVLEVGTGSGYLSALLAKSAGQLKTIDIHADFTAAARSRLESHAINNVELETTDVYQMLDDKQQYDVLVLTASLPRMDERFFNLLKNGGRMFAIIGESPVMEARLITKQTASSWSYEGLFETDLPAMIGALENEHFQF